MEGYICFMPYPTFSNDQTIYFRLEMIYCKGNNNRVVGNVSSILTRATLTEKEHFSYFEYCLYDETVLDVLDDDYEDEALKCCLKVAEAIWG